MGDAPAAAADAPPPADAPAEKAEPPPPPAAEPEPEKPPEAPAEKPTDKPEAEAAAAPAPEKQDAAPTDAPAEQDKDKASVQESAPISGEGEGEEDWGDEGDEIAAESETTEKTASKTVIDGEQGEEGMEKVDQSKISLTKKRSSLKTDEEDGLEREGSGLTSKAKMTVGSVISIRRASVGGETADKLKTARYMNTYKLDSDNPFNPEKVQKILESVMTEALEELTYDPVSCSKKAKWASSTIRARVKEMEFDRFKIISLVSIGERHSQDVLVTCRFLWDVERDRFATFTIENYHVYGIAQCFGLYYE